MLSWHQFDSGMDHSAVSVDVLPHLSPLFHTSKPFRGFRGLHQDFLRSSSAGTATTLPSRQIYIGNPSRACSSMAFSTAALSAIVARSNNGSSSTFGGGLIMLFHNALSSYCNALCQLRAVPTPFQLGRAMIWYA